MKKLILLIIMIGICVSVWSADTERTRAELETLFADNESGNISAQDLRDLVKSIYIIQDNDFPDVYRALIKMTFTDGHLYAAETEIIDSVGITFDAQSIEDGHLDFSGTGFADSTVFCNCSVGYNEESWNAPAIFYEIRVVSSTQVRLYGYVYDVGGVDFPHYEVWLNVEIIKY